MNGAHVIGTASASNQELLKEPGVEEAVDYTAGPFEAKIKNNEISALVKAGLLKTIVSTVLPLSEARRGQEKIASWYTRGKIVLQV